MIRQRASSAREAGRQRERAERAEHLLGRREALLGSTSAALQVERTEADEARRQFVLRLAALSGPEAATRSAGGLAVRVSQRLRDAHLPLRLLLSNPLRFVRGAIRLRHREYRVRVAQLAESALFDAVHYQAVTGAPPGTNLVARFILAGDAANESPHPLFDPAWYRGRYPDLPSGIPPLLHYLRHGGWEMRMPHPLFDARFYATQWPAPLHGSTPLSHYLRRGGRAGASPHPLFDAAYYLAQRPDLMDSGANPLLHYLAVGVTDDANPHPLFSTRYYLETNPQVAPQNPLEHFVRGGALEGRSPHPLFDIGYYWEGRPDVRASKVNPLVHYLEFGSKEVIDPHPLFDTRHYYDQFDGLHRSDVTPLVHFLRWGWRDGLRPSPWFDPLWYLARYPQARGINPLVHFLEHGWREGCDPSPQFSLARYRTANADVDAAGINPLVHYLRLGRSEGRGGVDPGDAASSPDRPLRLTIHGSARTTKTIMCVGHVSPWPVTAGNQYALSRLLHYFQDRGYRIVLVLAPIPGEPLAPGALDQLEAEFGNVVICDRSGKVEFRLRDIPDVLTPLGSRPAIEDYSSEPGPDLDFCHDALMAVVTRLHASVGRCAILAQYIFMTRLFTTIGPAALRVVHTHDVFSQKAANVLAYGIADAQITEEEEARLLNRADVVMAVTPEDADVLKRLAPARDVVLNKVDVTVQRHSNWPSRPVAFLAASGNQLNITGLRDFLKFAWPRVREAIPDAELRVAGAVGRSVPRGTAGVVALGHVPDLVVEYTAARVVINPAVAGTGLKIKTIEALAHLRPVVGWPHNRDGLAPALLRFVDEVTDWSAFSDSLARHLRMEHSPFDAGAVEDMERELSAAVSYRELEDRLARFFAGSRVGIEERP